MECLLVFQPSSSERNTASLSMQIMNVISIIARMIDRMLAPAVRNPWEKFRLCLFGDPAGGKEDAFS